MENERKKRTSKVYEKGIKYLTEHEYANKSNKELAELAGLTVRQFINLRARVKVKDKDLIKSKSYMRMLKIKKCTHMRAVLKEKGIKPWGKDDEWRLMINAWTENNFESTITLEKEKDLCRLRRALEKDKAWRFKQNCPYYFSRKKIDELNYEISVKYF